MLKQPRKTLETCGDQLQDNIANLNLHENFVLSKTDLPIDVLDDECYGSEDGASSALTWKIPAFDHVNTLDCFNVDKLLKSSTKSDGQRKMAEFFNIDAQTSPTTNPSYANLNKETLFSALVSKRVKDDHGVNLSLDIPDLPDDVSLFKWQIPTTESYDWIDYKSSRFNDLKSITSEFDSKNTVDEGFISNKSSPNSASSDRKFPDSASCQNVESENDVWEQSLKNFRTTEYLDWDMRDR